MIFMTTAQSHGDGDGNTETYFHSRSVLADGRTDGREGMIALPSWFRTEWRMGHNQMGGRKGGKSTSS